MYDTHLSVLIAIDQVQDPEGSRYRKELDRQRKKVKTSLLFLS